MVSVPILPDWIMNADHRAGTAGKNPGAQNHTYLAACVNSRSARVLPTRRRQSIRSVPRAGAAANSSRSANRSDVHRMMFIFPSMTLRTSQL